MTESNYVENAIVSAKCFQVFLKKILHFKLSLAYEYSQRTMIQWLEPNDIPNYARTIDSINPLECQHLDPPP